MKTREFLKYYFLSPAGIATEIAAIAIGSMVASRKNLVLGFVTVAASLLAMFALAVFTGIASRYAVKEKERRLWLAESALLEKVRLAADRLGSIRVADPELKRLAAAAALRSGEYYAACVRQRSHDPKATFAAGECLELLDAYLTELDESSTEKRHSLPDANPFADARERVKGALEDRVAIIAKGTLDIQGGLSANDRLEIKEQL